MTYTEIKSQVERLAPEEKRRLVNELIHDLQAATPPGTRSWLALPDRDETEADRRRRLAAIPPAEALLGTIKPEGHVPTDEELKADYINYLVRKYS